MDDTSKSSTNVPETQLPERPLTIQKVQQDATLGVANEFRLHTIAHEFKQGFDFLQRKEKSITIFGSAEFTQDNVFCKAARSLAQRIVRELGYAIVTGGGPGVMEAANHGAVDAGGRSYGICIDLPTEEVKNPYVVESVDCYYFFTRKVLLSFAASAYIYFPGGFGTLDELFEILTLVRTKKIQPLPIILVGREYWQPLQQFIEHNLQHTYHAIDPQDTALYTVTDEPDEIIQILKDIPARK